MSCGKGYSYEWTRESTTLLINLFQLYPCLYLITNSDYHNRNLRRQAINDIAKEFNKIKFTNLTPDDVKKKIRGVRTQYLSEIQKIRKSEASGASSCELYQPKLWCFEHLQFLQKRAVVPQEETNISTNVTYKTEVQDDYNEDNSPDLVFEEAESPIFSPSSSIDSDSRTESLKTGASAAPIKIRTPSTSGVQPTTQKRKWPSTNQDKITGLLDTVAQTLKHLRQEPKEEPHALFGQLIAEEMKSIKDEEILETLKESILISIFKAKKDQRELNKS